MVSRKKGEAGEDAAAAFLQERGMTIVARNYRAPRGEIDIIARDGEHLVFVEVKSFAAYGAESVEFAVDARKQRKIIGAARHFCVFHPEYAALALRFDVIFINGDGTGDGAVSPGKVTYFADAFGE